MYVNTSDWITRLWFEMNRLAGYALLNLLDDPALIAMAFC